MQMANEVKVRLLLHACSTTRLGRRHPRRWAIFQSEQGRYAVLAKVVVDTTGAADLIARAGAR